MNVLLWIVALILAGAGIASILIPEEMIYIREHARFRDFEPSDRYIRIERIKGVVSIVIAIIIIICII